MSFGEFMANVAKSKIIPRLRMSIDQAGDAPAAGDTVRIVVPDGWVITNPSITIDRGAGAVVLASAVSYVLTASDIPPAGGDWPLVPRGKLDELAGETFHIQNPVRKPGPPFIGVAVSGNGSVTCAYSAPASNGGSAITKYIALLFDAGGNVVQTNNNAPNPVVFTGLTNGTPYRVRVQAVNALGTGPLSAFSNAVSPSADVQAKVSRAFNGAAFNTTF